MITCDAWPAQGYSSSEPIQVSDFVFYCTWHNEAGAEIGVIADFEIDNDFHYEMPISEWRSFLNEVLLVEEPDDVTDAFRGYFLLNEGFFDFEGT